MTRLSKPYQAQAVRLNLDAMQTSLLRWSEVPDYLEHKAIPVQHRMQQWTIATAHPSFKNCKRIRRRWGKNTQIIKVPMASIIRLLETHFADRSVHEISYGLHERDPDLSVYKGTALWQRLLLLFSFTGLVLAIFIDYPITFYVLIIAVEFLVLLAWGYKLFLALVGLFFPVDHRDEEKLAHLTEFPVYTILVPLLREKKVSVTHLLNSLMALDYPGDALDIKFLLEADDEQTRTVLQALTLPEYVDVLIVPTGEPMTKPRACNYGLQWALGRYITIYDAEDEPDPAQLKKALFAFQQGDASLVCVQSELNYYNRYENTLTRFFSLEYTGWFDLILPALCRLKAPVPLGGTSNHFKVNFLREHGGWDAFNVTEDADLGIRVHRLGYRVAMINSTTYEEANCRLGNWIKQRTRWIKGYMQTYLLHMRQPVVLWRELGGWGFLSFHLFMGGSIVTHLSTVPLWLIFISSLFYSHFLSTLYSDGWLVYTWINFILGNMLLVCMVLLATLRRKQYALAGYALMAPLYYFLISIAGYRALYQMWTNPYQWEKTEHGISNFFEKKRDTGGLEAQ